MKEVSLFLDSGAYSAFSQGQSINLENYIAFIKQHQEYIDVYANLDVIGEAEATLKNQKTMESAGLKPIPCYHYGEDVKYLNFYVDHYSYIALGGLVTSAGSRAIMEHLDKCFTIICDTIDHMPKVKVHGFGMTSLKLLWRYPWWSCDSTSWVFTGRFGGIFVPRRQNGKYVYEAFPFKINVSKRSPSTKDEGQHFSTMSAMEQDEILDYINQKGFVIGQSAYRVENRKKYKLASGERWANSADVDACRASNEESIDNLVEVIIEPGLCNDYKKRDEINLMYFLDLENCMPRWPWPFTLTKKTRFGFK